MIYKKKDRGEYKEYKLYMVLEFMLEVPKALKKNQKLTEDMNLRTIAYQMLTGLAYLHSKFIFHRVIL